MVVAIDGLAAVYVVAVLVGSGDGGGEGRGGGGEGHFGGGEDRDGGDLHIHLTEWHVRLLSTVSGFEMRCAYIGRVSGVPRAEGGTPFC